MRARVALEPLAEEPGAEDESGARRRSGLQATLHRWARILSGGAAGDDARPAADLRVLLSVLACPLSPVPILPRLPRHVRILMRIFLQAWLRARSWSCFCLCTLPVVRTQRRWHRRRST